MAGIRITIDYSWFIIFLLVAWSVTSWFQAHVPGAGPGAVWTLAVVAALGLFASVLLHELSHSFVARFKGMEVERITLFIFGGVSHLGEEPRTPGDEIQIAVAGPVASFAIGGICLAAWIATLQAGMAWLSALASYLGLVNIALGLFNLVPAFPLDGGRVLRALLWLQKRSFTRATLAAARVGRILAFGLMGLGVLVALSGSFQGLWFVIVGLFLNQAAGASAEMALIRQNLSGTQVGRIMSRDPVTLSRAMSLADAVELAFLRHHYVGYPVTENGRVLGILTLKDIRAHPREEWPQRTVGEAMTRLGDDDMAHPEDDIVDVLEAMLRTGRGRLPVVRDGQLAGMLTRRDIMDFLRVRTDLAADD